MDPQQLMPIDELLQIVRQANLQKVRLQLEYNRERDPEFYRKLVEFFTISQRDATT